MTINDSSRVPIRVKSRASRVFYWRWAKRVMGSVAALGGRWLWVPEEETDDSRQGPLWGPAGLPGVPVAHVDPGNVVVEAERLGVVSVALPQNPQEAARPLTAGHTLMRWEDDHPVPNVFQTILLWFFFFTSAFLLLSCWLVHWFLCVSWASVF